jgi:hypothetical protein|tara:strand:+ start:366 stop:800 length:435 start_codon:yes stop_codon:yes gene_type:complete
MTVNKKPYVIVIAEIIYLAISKIKQDNSGISNIEAIDRFIGTKIYKEISSGKFHDKWFKKLKDENFVDKKTGEKIPAETIKLLEIQRDTIVKELKVPNLYYAKSSFPLESSQKAFDLIWRMCESYELWCKEAGRSEQIILNIID